MHTSLWASGYTKKTQVTSARFYCKPWESVVELFYTMPYKILLTVANTVSVTYTLHIARRSDVIPSIVQWLSCILIGCTFYSMLQNQIDKVKNDHRD